MMMENNLKDIKLKDKDIAVANMKTELAEMKTEFSIINADLGAAMGSLESLKPRSLLGLLQYLLSFYILLHHPILFHHFHCNLIPAHIWSCRVMSCPLQNCST